MKHKKRKWYREEEHIFIQRVGFYTCIRKSYSIYLLLTADTQGLLATRRRRRRREHVHRRISRIIGELSEWSVLFVNRLGNLANATSSRSTRVVEGTRGVHLSIYAGEVISSGISSEPWIGRGNAYKRNRIVQDYVASGGLLITRDKFVVVIRIETEADRTRSAEHKIHLP